MVNDFFIIFAWWFLLFGLGIILFPFTYYFFRGFFDRGYAFSKIIAILLSSYFIWILGSLKILPFTSISAWFVVGLITVSNLFLLKKNRLNLKKIFKENQRIFIFEELLFFASLAFWSFIRGFQPNIQGLEKFMDYGFVNSILRSRFFPPADIWLAGETINYYYFGHLTAAVLTKLSGLDSAITYNLMIATIFGLCFTAAFSLGSNFICFATNNKPRPRRGGAEGGQQTTKEKKKLKYILLGGLLTAFLLTLGGNLHPLYWFLKEGNFKTYWYPDATRFIVQKFGAADNTIHEFPLYSFVVADLHGHLINLPFVLLFLGLLLAFFTQTEKNHSLFAIRYSLLLSLCLAVFYITNTWDFAIYFLILGGITLWLNYLKYGLKFKTLSQTAPFIILNLLFVILFSLPFHLHFRNIAEGVKLVDFRSPPWMLLVLWGFPLLMTSSFLILLAKKGKAPVQKIDSLILIILAVAWFLILVPEVIYVKDIYTHSHQRANTMFKLTYQSFVMFSLTAGYIISRALISFRKSILKFFYAIFIFSFLIFIFLYPYHAIRSYYGLKVYRGLDGLQYLNDFYPDDYQAIVWLKKNIAGQPVIVEAVGESYTDFARVSANTGLPTVLGWRVHEWLWRGSFDEAAKRTEIVKTIYESSDFEETQQLLSQYGVNLVFIGDLEREQYPHLQEGKFDQIGKVIFKSGETKIYKLT